jgi:hypothetical protein
MTIVWQNSNPSRSLRRAPLQIVYRRQSRRAEVIQGRIEKTLDQLMGDVDMVLQRHRARVMLTGLKSSYDALKIGQHVAVKGVLREWARTRE